MSVIRSHRTLAYLVLVVGVLWTVLPLYWMLITAFKRYAEVEAQPPSLFPRTPVVDGFISAWQAGGARGLRDSAIVAVGVVVVCLVLGLPAAYSLSRYHTGGVKLGFAILALRAMPPIVLAAVLYLIAARVKMLDTYMLLILGDSIFNLPIVVWIMKGFIDDIPYVIEEAAQMDGASRLVALRDHVLPLVAPGLIVAALFVLVFTWNEFIFATVLTGAHILPFTRAVPGLNIGRTEMCTIEYCQAEPDWPSVCALGSMVLVPMVILAYFLQGHVARVVTYGAVSNA